MAQNVPEQDTIIKLLTVLFPESKIYLFGSRARGDYTDRSDIDIAIDLGRKMSIDEIARARNVIEALNIPQKTDIADLHRVEDRMKKVILQEGILWKS